MREIHRSAPPGTDAAVVRALAHNHGSAYAEVLALAGGRPDLGQPLAATSVLRAEIVHLPYFNLATRPLGDNLRKAILPERQGAWDTKQILSSFRLDQQGRLIFGSVGALRGPGRLIHPNWGRRALKHIFPQLSDVEFEFEWYGSIGMTSNNLPKLHWLGRNVISFSGYNGRGIAPGTTFGRALAQLILGEIAEADLPLPVTDPTPIRYRAVQEAYYEVGAQIAHVASDRL